jgi:hypothetical protein
MTDDVIVRFDPEALFVALPRVWVIAARVVLLVGATVVAAQHVMQYAAAVKSEPSTSHVAHLMPEHRTHFLSGRADGACVNVEGLGGDGSCGSFVGWVRRCRRRRRLGQTGVS